MQDELVFAPQNPILWNAEKPHLYTVQLAGTSDKLDAFLATLREVAKIVEVARSGVVGLSRGDKIMR